MKSRLLISDKLPVAEFSRKNNHDNGNEAEFLSASSLISAFGAEIRWGSRNEDGSKIDLFISFNHPWKEDRIILLVQIKSGNGYVSPKSDGTVKFYKRAFNEVK